MSKRYAFSVALVATCMLSFFVACASPSVPSAASVLDTAVPLVLQPGEATGNMAIGFLVPDWAALVAAASESGAVAKGNAAAKVISSQATDVRLVLDDVVGPWVGLSTFASEELVGTPFKKYKNTFRLPARAYSSIGVELGWGDGTGMNVYGRVGVCIATVDSNGQPIVVTQGSTIQVTGTVIPKGAWSVTVGQNRTWTDGSALPAKGMRFYKFSATQGASYVATLSNIADGGLFIVDNTGKLLLDADATPSANINGSGTASLAFTIAPPPVTTPVTPPTSSGWYLALYAPTGGDPLVNVSRASVASIAAATTPVINEVNSWNNGIVEIANFSTGVVDFTNWSIIERYKTYSNDGVHTNTYVIHPKDQSNATMSCPIASGGYLVVRMFNWGGGFKNQNCLEAPGTWHWEYPSGQPPVQVMDLPQSYKDPILGTDPRTGTFYQNYVYARDANDNMNTNSLYTWGDSWSLELRDPSGALVDYVRVGNASNPVPLPFDETKWPQGSTVPWYSASSLVRAITIDGAPVDSNGPSEWVGDAGTLGARNDAIGVSDLSVIAN